MRDFGFRSRHPGESLHQRVSMDADGKRVGTEGKGPTRQRGNESRLERYSRVLGAVEVNSSFYRPHRAATWARWGDETPEGFRFSIKAPKTITHEARLKKTEELLDRFLEQIAAIREKTGWLLFQLPPSLAYEAGVAEEFLAALRERYSEDVALEPRHASWFTEAANDLLRERRIARVAADPAVGGSGAGKPGGDERRVYYRLHGSPRTYYSNYEEEFLVALAERVRGAEKGWVIFDNTAQGCAYQNAIRLQELLED
jgi:uncharacterized protein YecE (DUF72 family)